MKKFEIIDDLFSREEENLIEDLIFTDQFPWYFSNKTVYNNFTDDDYNWFYHLLTEDNQHTSQYTIDVLNIFIKKYNTLCKNLPKHLVPDFNQIYRMRFNLALNANEDRKTPIHVDQPFNHLTMIYYINNSDGVTVLDGISNISPKKGRILIFDGRLEHCAFFPKISPKRSVINFNLGITNENCDYWTRN